VLVRLLADWRVLIFSFKQGEKNFEFTQNINFIFKGVRE